MRKRRKAGARPVSRREIASLTRKLHAWGTTLSPGEQALLQVMTNQASMLDTRMVHGRARQRLAVAVRQIFGDIAGQVGVEGWVRIDPIWYKSGAILGGEEVQITGKVVMK